MATFLTIVHVILCLFLIGVVLLQSGRAGGMGVLSGGASQQVFGGRGAGNFLQKVTGVAAFMFLLTCATLGYIASSTRDRGLASLSAPSIGNAPTRADGGAPADAAQRPATPPSFLSITPPTVAADAGPAAEPAPTAEPAPAAPAAAGDAGAP
ncbi:MAG: preprotein translocase subunit SecG [Deltaproteobacteria bacterium]|nr:preprotein translocase subunit SecG [Deltaproteobacteria bacterium]